jgi:hypothetical protein
MQKPRPLYLESTDIPAAKTAAEIQALLIVKGARNVSMDLDANQKITGMHFILMVAGLPYQFRLPVRTDAVQELFKKRRIQTMKWKAFQFEHRDKEQAERVAFRQLLAWLKAQFAMIDAGMVQAHEVLSPYLLNADGQTLFEYLVETRFKALPAGKQA